MAKIYIPAIDEQFTRTLRDKGLGVPSAPHWIVARLALARSLQMPQFPDAELKRPLGKERGFEIHMEQLTGENTPSPDMEDLTDSFRLLLSMYHGEDLFADRDQFVELLQRHVQRGMTEIQHSWREPNDFHDYLYQELFFEWISDDEESVEKLSDRVRLALGEIGVNATIEKINEGPRISRFTLHLASGADLDRLKRGLDKIPFELGIQRPVTLQAASGERRMALDVPRPERDWRPIEGSIVSQTVCDASGALPVCPGVDVLGKAYTFDLAETPHLFVAGSTGSGKSVCVHAIILSLLASGRNVRLALIDPKEVEFPVYAGSSKLWNGAVVTEVSDAETLLNELVTEMDERQEEMAKLGAQNLAEAHDKGSKLPRVVVVVDELADLLTQNKDIQQPIVRLAQKARATGIHLVLATQRPDAQTFIGTLRTNLLSRIALAVRSGTESRIILDEMGAEKLLGRGDMILRLGTGHSIRLHGARVEQGDIRAWL